jgi:hypothetical protein
MDILRRNDLLFPGSLPEFQRLFPDGKACAAYLEKLRWLKSLIGLKGPPGTDERSAKPYLLAHLLMILLLEPLVDELEDSPRWGLAA